MADIVERAGTPDPASPPLWPTPPPPPRPYTSPLLGFLAGVVANFYGRHLTYSLLFAQVYKRNGEPFVRRLVQEVDELIRRARSQGPQLQEATSASRDAMRRLNQLQEAYLRERADGGNEHEASVLQAELQDLQDELQHDVLRMGAAGSSLLETLDPHRLSMLLRGLYIGFVGLASAATTNGARKLGIGFDIGERVARAIHEVVAPAVRRLLPELSRYWPALGRLYTDPRFDWWLDLALTAFCSSVGIGIAVHVERLVFVGANCVWGAEMIVDAATACVSSLLPRRWQEQLEAPSHQFVGAAPAQLARLSAVLLVATSGLYYQARLGGKRMPLAMRAILFAPLLAERALEAATFAVRGPLASVAHAQRRASFD